MKTKRFNHDSKLSLICYNAGLSAADFSALQYSLHLCGSCFSTINNFIFIIQPLQGMIVLPQQALKLIVICYKLRNNLILPGKLKFFTNPVLKYHYNYFLQTIISYNIFSQCRIISRILFLLEIQKKCQPLTN